MRQSEVDSLKAGITCQLLADTLYVEMKILSDDDLIAFAKNMGVDPKGLDRHEIEEACVYAEQYAFTN